MLKVDLIQPRHNYAPPISEERIGHVYMPTSLLTAAARLLNADVDVEIHDENIQSYKISSRHVGINLLGSPYIPEVIKLQKRIDEETQGDAIYLLGGQVVAQGPQGLTSSQFSRLFGSSAYDGNNDATLAKVLGIDSKALTSPEKTSLVPAYEKIPETMMKKYLSREFGLYVSQGCSQSCNFCAAVRTFEDPITKEVKRINEVYRDSEIIHDDLEYLVSRAERLGVKGLKLYMSNLDVFQTPRELLKFAQAVKNVKRNHPNFCINLRGLATTAFYLKARDYDRKSVDELVEAGFHTVGFGVDGMTKQVWDSVNKKFNTEYNCKEVIRSAKQDFGITPEVLMVFGHLGGDTKESLKHAYDFTKEMIGSYGAVPRPHVAKSFIPGNNGWGKPQGTHKQAIETLLQNPELFQSLDFTALPTNLTHPHKKLRKLATKYFLKMCELEGNTTQWVKPIEPGMSEKEIEEIKQFNKGKYDR